MKLAAYPADAASHTSMLAGRILVGSLIHDNLKARQTG
jgi:hypothetical protein